MWNSDSDLQFLLPFAYFTAKFRNGCSCKYAMIDNLFDTILFEIEPSYELLNE